MDEEYKRAFTTAYLRYEIAFARLSVSQHARADDPAQPDRYRAFSDAQQAFLEAAHGFARYLLDQAEADPAHAAHAEGARGRMRHIRVRLLRHPASGSAPDRKRQPYPTR